MKLSIVAGATSQTVNVFIQNSASTVGAGLTGLVYNSTGMLAYYVFAKTAPVLLSGSGTGLATQTATGAWATCGFVEIDSAKCPGLYRLDIPNAALAAGNGRFVTIYLFGVANMAPCVLEIALTAVDYMDAVRFGLTALPNAAASAVGGLPVAVDTSGRVDVLKVNGTSQTARDLGAQLDAAISTRSTYAGADTAGTTTLLTRIPGTVAAQTGDSYARLGAPAGASLAADVAAVKTDTGNLRTDYTTARAVKLDNLDAAVSGIAAAVWVVGTRTLTSFGTLVADIATAIWAAGSRTLSAFGFTVNTASDANVTAIKAKTDNLPAVPAAQSDCSTIPSAVWAYGTRILTAFGFNVTASSVTDKTGYSLATPPPTAVEVRTEMDLNSAKLAAILLQGSGTTVDPDAIAQAILKADFATVTGEAARSLVNAARSLRNNVYITDNGDGTGTVTVTKEDDVTIAWTARCLFDSTGQPISAVDPTS